jgi:hypothetical protein
MWPRSPTLRSGRRATAQSILADRPSRRLGRLIDKPSDNRALPLQGWITGRWGANAAGVAIIVLHVTDKPHLNAGRSSCNLRLEVDVPSTRSACHRCSRPAIWGRAEPSMTRLASSPWNMPTRTSATTGVRRDDRGRSHRSLCRRLRGPISVRAAAEYRSALGALGWSGRGTRRSNEHPSIGSGAAIRGSAVVD